MMLAGFLRIFSLLLSICSCKALIDYTLQSFRILEMDRSILEQNYNVIRIERGVYSVEFNMTFHLPIDEKWEMKVDIYRSALGNNQFELMPFKLARCKCLDFFNNYHSFIDKSFQERTNFPILDHYDKPIPAGFYYIDQTLFDTSKIKFSPSVGLYKGLVYWYYDNRIVYSAEILVKINFELFGK